MTGYKAEAIMPISEKCHAGNHESCEADPLECWCECHEEDGT